jgi:long-chain fatty acid transport protein
MAAKVVGRWWGWFDSVHQPWIPWICLLGLCMGCIPGMASAQVPRIQGQGAAASAMSNAFAAQADDLSALHYNPAGMTQLRGVQLMAGALIAVGKHAYVNFPNSGDCPSGVTSVSIGIRR